MNYNDLERNIALIISPFPRLRSFLKYWYKRLNYLIYTCALIKREGSDPACVLGFDDGRSCFFGYYGKCQINGNGKFLLCLSDLKKKMPNGNDILDLYVGEINNEELKKFASSRSWNWQQGCMLQWMNYRDRNIAVYNDYRDGKFISVIIDVDSGSTREFEQPVYAVSKSNNFSLTLNFSRLYLLNTAYGYCNDGQYQIESMAPKDDGIWHLDFESGKSRLIISIARLAEFYPKPSMKKAYHKVNHIEISPGENRFMFLHRWIKKGRKKSRLVTSNIDGTTLFVLANGDMVSHCTWKNDNQILAWARKKEIGDRFFLFEDQSTRYSVVGEGKLTQDGHPTFSKDGRFILIDTYPDKLRMQSLILYDIESCKKKNLGKFYSPLKFDGYVRCDLHPRFSHDGNHISFDSCHKGSRKSFILDMSEKGLTS